MTKITKVAKKVKPVTKLVLDGEVFLEETREDGTVAKHEVDGKLVLKILLQAIEKGLELLEKGNGEWVYISALNVRKPLECISMFIYRLRLVFMQTCQKLICAKRTYIWWQLFGKRPHFFAKIVNVEAITGMAQSTSG